MSSAEGIDVWCIINLVDHRAAREEPSHFTLVATRGGLGKRREVPPRTGDVFHLEKLERTRKRQPVDAVRGRRAVRTYKYCSTQV